MRPVVTLLALLLTSSACTFGLGDYETSDGPRDYGAREPVETSIDGTEPDDSRSSDPPQKDTRQGALGPSGNELVRETEATRSFER